jgi:preprotein translocase SecE subunit
MSFGIIESYEFSPTGAFFRIRAMNLSNYLKETKNELKEVTFPSIAQTISYTIAIIVICILVAALLGSVDFGLKEGLIKLLGQ